MYSYPMPTNDTALSLRLSGSFYEEFLHSVGELPAPTGRLFRRALPGEPHDMSATDPADFTSVPLRLVRGDRGT